MDTTQLAQVADVKSEVKQTLGLVPQWFEHVPAEVAPQMWGLMREMDLGETHIPGKYKQLIGLGVAAATHCRYCTHFHTEAAKLHGATPEEIAEANAVAFTTRGFSAFLHGSQVDYDQFRSEVGQIVQHIRSQS